MLPREGFDLPRGIRNCKKAAETAIGISGHRDTKVVVNVGQH